jgi:hypothetical protein
MSFPTKVDMPNHLVTLLRTQVFEETYLGQGQGKNLQILSVNAKFCQVVALQKIP